MEKNFRRGKLIFVENSFLEKIFSGENIRHLTKISLLFPDEVFPDSVLE